MKTNKLSQIGLIFLLGGSQFIHAQDYVKSLPPEGKDFCGTSEAMKKFYQANVEAREEQEAREAFTAEFVKNFVHKEVNHSAKTAAPKYRIPVVCHVYGTTFWGKPLTDAQIISAIEETNKDINGGQADYATVNINFANIKSTIDMSFELAKIDPNGKPTNGIDRKTTTGAGYGNGTPPAQLALDAWDNKKYMNVYIVSDIYNDGDQYNSGVAWYPNVSMTNAKTARVVYNGQYIGSNTGPEFRSVLTHEFGHFFNLIHTFQDCSPGDNVADTPPHLKTNLGCPTSQTSNTPLTSDCTPSHVVNAENYMDYNGASCGQKNFTKGQVARMEAALNLNDVTRFPLWQTSNLVATGLLSGVGVIENSNVKDINVYPNPNNGVFTLDISLRNEGTYKYEITDILGNVISSSKIENDKLHFEEINLTNQSKGVYFLHLTGDNCDKTVKVVLQ